MAFIKVISAIGLVFLILGCDPEGKKKCDWVLEPEPSLIGKTDDGYIPVCARNRKTQKQDCRMQATMEYAKESLGRKFRYIDIRTENAGLPRTITTIKFCEDKK